MLYATVYDAYRSGEAAAAFPPVSGLPLLAIAALLVLTPDLVDQRLPQCLRGAPSRIFSGLFFIAAAAFVAQSLLISYGQYREAATAIAAGRYSVVEGVVTDFDPTPYHGHRPESFTVSGRRFSYDAHSPGLHTTAAHGGPIRAGLQVRIAYCGPVILRVEASP